MIMIMILILILILILIMILISPLPFRVVPCDPWADHLRFLEPRRPRRDRTLRIPRRASAGVIRLRPATRDFGATHPPSSRYAGLRRDTATTGYREGGVADSTVAAGRRPRPTEALPRRIPAFVSYSYTHFYTRISDFPRSESKSKCKNSCAAFPPPAAREAAVPHPCPSASIRGGISEGEPRAFTRMSRSRRARLSAVSPITEGHWIAATRTVCWPSRTHPPARMGSPMMSNGRSRSVFTRSRSRCRSCHAPRQASHLTPLFSCPKIEPRPWLQRSGCGEAA
jgi:hypothetical protein